MKIDNSKINENPRIAQPHVTDQSKRVVCVQPNQIPETKDWKRGLHGCCNNGVSCPLFKALFFPCVLFGELSQQTGYGDCFLCGVAYCVLFSPIWMYVDLSCFVYSGLRK